jgi:glucose/arabinose dehydrogenase
MRWLAATFVVVGSGCALNVESTETTENGVVDNVSSAVIGREPTLEVLTEIEQPVDATMREGVSRSGVIFRYSMADASLVTALDVSDLTEAEGERGLLGLAFSPDGTTAYLNYTDLSGDTQIVALDVDGSGMLTRSTMRTLLTVKQPYSNHNGGDIVVEPSGTVLVATGDGGAGGDPDRVALDDRSLLGKVLRIDPATGEVSIVARGLRNPWRIDLHGDRLWLADVGQGQWEEVSVLENVSQVTATVDFGWSAYEGFSAFNDDQESSDHTPPLMVYEHGDDGCSISGGAVGDVGFLEDRYVFADYCSGKVWSISTSEANPTKELLFEGIESPVAIVRAGAEVLVLSLEGTIWRIVG